MSDVAIGQIVHYAPHMNHGECVPAMILRVIPTLAGHCDLHIFGPGSLTSFEQSKPHSTQRDDIGPWPGTWHWPEEHQDGP